MPTGRERLRPATTNTASPAGRLAGPDRDALAAAYRRNPAACRRSARQHCKATPMNDLAFIAKVASGVGGSARLQAPATRRASWASLSGTHASGGLDEPVKGRYQRVTGI